MEIEFKIHLKNEYLFPQRIHMLWIALHRWG
jgi:hypothetical protein